MDIGEFSLKLAVLTCDWPRIGVLAGFRHAGVWWC